MPKEAHNKQTCLYCIDNRTYMTTGCVADELGLAEITVYTGGAGTQCLFAGRIRRGSKVFYLRCRVEEHQRLEVEHGECDGSCRRVKPSRAARGGLELVAAG